MDPKSRLSSDDAAIASLTAIVVAYVSRNEISPSDLPPLIARIQCVLNNSYDDPSLGAMGNSLTQQTPIASPENSINEDYLICLEDGKRFKSLKRHLKTKYNLNPDEYRRKWNLPPDYPMVAPAYAQARSKIARNLGLGVTISKRNGKLEEREE
jgi:predicted transcriptional regulator